MAGSERIEYGDLMDPEAGAKIIEFADTLLDRMSKLDGVFKNMMVSQKGALKISPKSLEDVEKIQEATNKTKQLNEAIEHTAKAKQQLTLDVAKAKIEQENYNKSIKETAKEQMGLVSEYKLQDKLLTDMRNRYKDLVLTQKQSTAEGKLLLKNITTLDQKLKAVDATVGQHQRHVGNYRGAIKELGKGLHGLTGVLVTLGSALGIDTEHLEHAAHLTKELVKVSKEFSHASKIAAAAKELESVATEANTVVTESNVVAKEAEVVAVEASNAAWLATPIGIFAAVALGIAAVTLAVIEFTKSEEDSAEAIHLFNEAVNEQDMNIAKLKMSIIETTVANKALTGDYSQSTADRLGVQFEAIKKESDVTFAHKNAVKKINEEYAKEELKSQREQIRKTAQGLIFAGNSVEFLEEERKKKLIILENKYQTELSLIKTESALKQAEVSNEARKQAEEKNKKEQVKDEIDYAKILRDLRTGNIVLEYERRSKEIQDNYDDETKRYAGHTEILYELAVKRGQALEELYREQQREYTKILEDAEKEREAQIKKVQDDAKRMSSENGDVGFSKSLATDFAEAEKKKKEKEKADKEERENAVRLAEDLYKIEKDAIERRNKLNMEAIDYKLAQNKTAIELQTQLAAAGEANTLQYELDKQNRLEKQRVEELQRQEKIAKRQEAVEIGLAFLKAYTSELNSGKKPAQALSLAATETLAAKLLGKAIAGNFAEGVENFQGKGTGTSDSNIIGFSNHESVVTAKGTAETKGLVTAVNKNGFDGAVDWAMENIYRPQFNSGVVLEDVSKSAQVDNSINKVLIEEVKNLGKIIQEKPVSNSSLDNAGNTITELIKGQLRILTTKKRRLN